MTSQPTRGDRSAYARYLSGMDASMRQKVALTAAHLLCEGRVADMGMGSGAGSQALAALYPQLDVIGVDVDPEMVAIARETHVLPNLSFVQGDVATECFPRGSLAGILDSSVLHHVTSFGGYRHQNAGDAIAAQVHALREHGVLVVRDFLHPGEGEVFLDLPANDGDASDDPARASTATLFERFAREFRSLHASPGFAYERVEVGAPDGWRRYRCALVHAVEFALRKDYRTDWVAEAREEYTYFTRDGFESTLHALGLRVLSSTPLRNPWIVRHRVVGKLAMRPVDRDEPLDPPATNYVIVGEKVRADEGVRFEDRGDHPPVDFLRLSSFVDVRSGARRDLASRRNATVDVVPFFERDGDLFVVGRASYPRPLATTTLATPPIDGSRVPPWMAEPLIALQTDAPLGTTVERALEHAARIPAERIRAMHEGSTYYPSPGGTEERVTSTFVEIEPLVATDSAPRGALRSGGRVRAIEARQLLRAAQVGGMPDARLETNTYDLLARKQRDRGPWIGEAITLREVDRPETTTMTALLARPPRRVFRATDERADFLDVRCRRFAELAADGSVLGEIALELVLPRTRSTSSVAVAPLVRAGGTIWIGVDDDDLPAAQCFRGRSDLLVAPAWRLPREMTGIDAAREWTLARLADEHGIVTGDVFELGGPFVPSAGLSPELVFPLAVEVLAGEPRGRALRWIELADAVRNATAIEDGHLRVLVQRAAHALGVG